VTTTTVIAATTSAISDKSPRYHANGGQDVIAHATGLAGAETITPYIGGGSGWTAIFDSTGTQVKLTATKPQLVLAAGALYAFDKDATAGATSLQISSASNL
jgi:hypothetical protein